jgi:alanyl-tRNA synthetase
LGSVKKPTGLTRLKTGISMSNDVNTPEQEVNDAPEETVNDEQVTGDETVESTDETVGSYQDEDDSSKVPDSIPKARLDKEINRRKELEAKLEALEKEKEADPKVDDAAKDPDVKELAEKLAKIEQKELSAKRDAALQAGLDKALNEYPEFNGVANADVVKQMALNPANKNKTFKDLLEEAYGNAIPGKRTTETTTPRGGAADTKLDESRLNDPEYKKEIFANPDLKKQYNEGLVERLSSVF